MAMATVRLEVGEMSLCAVHPSYVANWYTGQSPMRLVDYRAYRKSIQRTPGEQWWLAKSGETVCHGGPGPDLLERKVTLIHLRPPVAELTPEEVTELRDKLLDRADRHAHYLKLMELTDDELIQAPLYKPRRHSE